MASNELIIQVNFESNKTQKPFKDLDKKASQAGKKSGDSFSKSFKGSTKNVGKSLAKGFIAFQAVKKGLQLLSGQISETFNNFRQFERELANINSILPKNAKLTKDATIEIEKLSAAYGTNKQAQAKAFYNIVSAGVKGTAKQLRVLETANEAATAGLVDIDSSARVIVSSMNSYSKANLTAIEASDALFVAVREGQTTFGELEGSIGNVTSIAANAGVKFSELTGALAFVTKSGIKTDIATTGLRQVFASVIKPSKEAADEAKNLGLQFNKGAIEAKGFAHFLKQVQEKTKGNERSLSKLFGNVRALAPILNIVNGNFEDFNRILKETENSAGATALAANEIKKSLDFQLGQVNSEWQSFTDNLLKTVLPAIRQTTSALKYYSKGLNDMTRENTGLEANSEAILANADAIADWTKSLKANKADIGGFFTFDDANAKLNVEKAKRAIKTLTDQGKRLLEERKKLTATPEETPTDTPSAKPPASLSDTAVNAAKANASRLKALTQNTSKAINAQFISDQEFLKEQYASGLVDKMTFNDAMVQLEANKNKKIEAIELAKAESDINRFGTVGDAYVESLSRMKMSTMQLGKSLADLSVNGFGKMMKNMGAAIAKGESLNQVFLDSVKATVAEAASALGDYYIKNGVVRIAESYGTDGTGYAMVAGGGALKMFAGAMGAGGSGSGGEGAGSSTGASSFGTAGIEDEQDVEERTAKTEVTLNVEGSLVRQEELGQYIAETLNEVSQKNDFALIDARFA